MKIDASSIIPSSKKQYIYIVDPAPTSYAKDSYGRPL